jgi:cytochrome c-type biogenesis protein CcmH
MLWGILGIMLLAAALVVVWPVYRYQRRFSLLGAVMVVVVTGVAMGLYSRIGTPTIDAAEAEISNVEEMVKSLDARLQDNPDDLEGWKMLGRSYVHIGNPAKAIAAFEKAVALEGSENAATLISLGEALLMNDQAAIGRRAGQLFESGLALEPDNPRALFYAGLAAAERGDVARAADRWEALLAQSPPAEIEGILRQRIAQWRGIPAANAEQATESVPDAVPLVSIDIKVGEQAAAVIGPASSVFVIARDPSQPSPPLAVARHTAGELPMLVSMSDADAMIPGRILSAYESLEIIVRVSASGQPVAQTGDWYGQSIVRPKQSNSVAIVIDRQVP